MDSKVLFIGVLGIAAVGGMYMISRKAGPESIINDLVKQGKLPADYTAKESELDTLISLGYDQDSAVYQKFVNLAYAKAAAEAEQIGGFVAWSAELGFYASTEIVY